MSVVEEARKNSLSDSDDDLYTSSIDIRKVRAAIKDCSNLPQVASSSNGVKQESTAKPGLVTIDDDDSDSLNLSEPENTFSMKSAKSRQKRLQCMEKEEMLELEEILSDNFVEVLPNQKRSKCFLSNGSTLQECPEVVLDEPAPLTREHNSVNGDSLEADMVEPEKDINLFVTVCVDQENGKPGRFMTIRQDEPFDSLRPTFAKELKCNQLDVLIHVNNVDAGPGDTPDSMGLDVNKLALVNVFRLKSSLNLEEDLSTNSDFIPVKCIFADGRPRCAYINLMESFGDAKERIRKQLKLPRVIHRLIFDNEIINDEETPQSIGIEAEDVIEVHLML